MKRQQTKKSYLIMLGDKENEIVNRYAEELGISRSEMIRKMIRRYDNKDEKIVSLAQGIIDLAK